MTNGEASRAASRALAPRPPHAATAAIAFLGMESSPSFVRQPECNGCVERFIRTLKEQLLWVRVFQNVEELRGVLAEFRERYNQKRLHSALAYRPPAEFEFAVRAGQAAAARPLATASASQESA